MIPLHITGKVQIEGLDLDMDHHYYIPGESGIEVSEGAKLVVLIISDLEWFRSSPSRRRVLLTGRTCAVITLLFIPQVALALYPNFPFSLVWFSMLV